MQGKSDPSMKKFRDDRSERGGIGAKGEARSSQRTRMTMVVSMTGATFSQGLLYSRRTVSDPFERPLNVQRSLPPAPGTPGFSLSKDRPVVSTCRTSARFVHAQPYPVERLEARDTVTDRPTLTSSTGSDTPLPEALRLWQADAVIDVKAIHANTRCMAFMGFVLGSI